MSLVQPPAPERRPSPSLELGTNNPFRARLSGIGPASPASNPDRFSYASSGSGRPQSRNPFLDVFDDDDEFSRSDQRPTQRANSFDSSQQKTQLSGSAAELFENLTVTDHSQDPFGMNRPADRGKRPPPPPRPHGEPRSPPPNYYDSVDEPQLISLATDQSRPAPRRPAPRDRSRNGERSRDDREKRRPRRNSDSSVIDAHEAEKDHSRRERRHRDHKTSRDEKSSRDKSSRDKSSDRRKKNPAVDVIDKLDVTGIYGPGLFHHDGPFDACNPHRNKSSRRLAPVQAFPEDSENMAMTGSGPLNMRPDHSQLFGNRDPEAFNDYTHVARPSGNRSVSFDPKKAADAIHGDESFGLGTSTFLDGAPAPRNAIQRALTDMDDRPTSSEGGGGFGGGGLQRKKSLAQKIRGLSQNKNGDGSGRRRAPPPPGQRSPPFDSPTSDGATPKGGDDKNPFFNDYNDAYDRKGESISVVRRERAPSNPSKGLTSGIDRTGTDKSSSENGLLKRVRSLSKPKQRRSD